MSAVLGQGEIAVTPAEALYRTALTASCRCLTAWQGGLRVLVSRCHRCESCASWEASQGLPAQPRISDYLPAAKGTQT